MQRSTELADVLLREYDRRGMLLVPPVSADDLRQALVINDDVEHALLMEELGAGGSLPADLERVRMRFYESDEDDRRTIEALDGSRYDDALIESARRRLVDQLRAKRLRGAGPDETAVQSLVEAVRALRADQRALLARLGVEVAVEEAPAGLFHLLATTESARSRERVRLAWDAVGARRHGELVAAVDAVAAERSRAARRRGARSPVAESLRGSTIDERAVCRFLDAYLAQAIVSLDDLADELATALQGRGIDLPADIVLQHAEFAVRSLVDGDRARRWQLADVVDALRSLVRQCFALDLVTEDDRRFQLLTGDGTVIGHITVDFTDGRGVAHANHTVPTRNRHDGSPRRTSASRVSLGFPAEPGLTAQNVQSLMHEFGHALNHAFMRPGIPNLSGLENLPVELSETFALWFEKWPLRADWALLDDEARARIAMVKSVEYRRSALERGVIAALDLAVHTGDEVGIEDAFAAIAARHDFGARITLDDVLPSFGEPMFRARPGAHFAYLWGAVQACTAVAEERHALDCARDWSAAGNALPEPDPSVLFRWYRELVVLPRV
ncbi:hypothetical protein AAEP80_03430 [Curtobacterium sp. L3-7]|uniref:hypothetical protein n=1 Tax=Curtobacterium sp. L3-7 TaxID=3138787 RepID=UPI003B520935